MTFPRLLVKRPVRSLRDIEPTPKWVERLPLYAAALLVGAVWTISAAGFGMHLTHRAMIDAERKIEQAEKDTAAADSLVAGCMSIKTGQRLLEASERTAGMLNRGRLYQAWVLHLTASSVEYEVSR